MRTSTLVSIALLSVCSGLAHADWTDWRGPTADGRSDATGLPLTWDDEENIVWQTPIHGAGYSTPVVLDGRVWLTAAPENGRALYAICIDLETGRIIHDINLFQPESPEYVSPLNTYATPSVALEKGRAYVHFGTYGTACLDSATGEVLWKQTSLHVNHLHGPGASPFLFEDLLYLTLDGVDAQFTAALNKNTGDIVWRTDRPREYYEHIPPDFFYYAKAYVTPIIVRVDGKPQLVSNGSQVANGYDPYTGEELWRVVCDSDNSIARVVSGQGLIFVNGGGFQSRARLLAVREGGTGNITDSHVAWETRENVGLSPSPVLADDLIYIVSERGRLTCLVAKTGEVVWSERLRGKYGASLLYAEGRIYVVSERGITTVVEHGRTFRILAVNDLGGTGIWASPAVTGKSLLLRTETHLYRIQSK